MQMSQLYQHQVPYLLKKQEYKIILNALQGYERDRKKTKNIKHNGNLTLEQIKKVARAVEEKSLAKSFTGTVK